MPVATGCSKRKSCRRDPLPARSPALFLARAYSSRRSLASFALASPCVTLSRHPFPSLRLGKSIAAARSAACLTVTPGFPHLSLMPCSAKRNRLPPTTPPFLAAILCIAPRGKISAIFKNFGCCKSTY